MTDFEVDPEQEVQRPPRRPAADRDQDVMPRAARRAERLAYCDEPEDDERWQQVRREMAKIILRLG